jgi:hypothetical protein
MIKRTGIDILRSPIAILVFLLIAIGLGYLIASGGLRTAIMLVAIPPVLLYLNRFFVNPRIGIYTVIILAFTAIGLNRYIPGIPLGLSIDGVLVLTYIAIFFKYFYRKLNLEPLQNELTLLALIWFLYTMAEFFNPLALSRTAWFYAMRGIALYMLLTIPLTLLIFNKVKYLYIFLYMWAFWTVLVTLKGVMQMTFGPDFAEQRWLDQGGAVTHIIFGELRIFSFLSDAGQFGAAQGVAFVVGTILALKVKGFWNKVIFWSMALTGFYGMMISGTRGAIIVPGVGFLLYLIYTKNFRAIIVGLLLMAAAFSFFRYTYIGQGISQIRRMRTAFRPADNASLQVRLQTKAILREYMKDKPFGGGVGAAGNWGKRFSPQGFLANIATDSWYVQIWAEMGLVGLMLHLIIIFYILLRGSYLIMVRLEDPTIIGIMSALMAGYAGLMGASYGNGVFGQLPSGIMVYMSMAFIFLSPWLDDEMIALRKKNEPVIRLNLPF